jgi:ParB family chromosome partitioning protein
MAEKRKSAVEIYGAESRTDILQFDPENILIVDDKTHPMFDERHTLAVDKDMVASIKLVGVIEPVLVKLDTDLEKTVCAVGRQRIKACRQANIELAAEGLPVRRMPAVVSREDYNILAAKMVIENEHRIPDTTLVRARKAEQLTQYGWGKAQIAMFFKVQPQTIGNWSRLLECSSAVQKAVEKGLPVAEALEIAKLDKDKQAAALAAVAGGEKALTGRKARSARAEATGNAPERKRASTKALQALVSEFETGEDADGSKMRDACPEAWEVLQYAMGVPRSELPFVDRMLPKVDRKQKPSSDIEDLDCDDEAAE